MKALFTTESLFALATKWAAKNPELTDRLARAHVLVLKNGVRVAGDGEFYVDATDGEGAYIVATSGEKTECTCADFAHRKLRCKHILAAALFHSLTTKPSKSSKAAKPTAHPAPPAF